MTVIELIKKLQEFPEDLEVSAEGCDCINPVSGAILSPEIGGRVLIEVTL